MSLEQIAGIVRAIAAAGGGYLVGKGYLTADTMNWIVGGLVTFATAGWSWWSNKPKKA